MRSATIASSCGRASRRASSSVSATHTLTVRKVTGSDAYGLGWKVSRYSASISAVPCPEKWWAKTYGSPSSAARRAE